MSVGFICFADRRQSRFDEAIPCSLCAGIGTVDEKQAEWWRVGRAHSTARVARGEGVREAARRLGIAAARLSAMEHGREDPAGLAP